MTSIKNLTPHTINVLDDDGNAVATFLSEGVARCAVENTQTGDVNGIPIYSTTYGEVTGLPTPQDGVYYIVSLLVRSALPDRHDLLSPGTLVRDEGGRPIGCKGFSGN